MDALEALLGTESEHGSVFYFVVGLAAGGTISLASFLVFGRCICRRRTGPTPRWTGKRI
eukprot:m.303751 g.303751  ORF g.303751 m.303751 type:complete len:59 (+) comp16156_c0_seq1:69-245(+)